MSNENIYAAAALDYWDAGWRGILPFRPGTKYPPPSKTTGSHPDPSTAAPVYGWVEDRPDWNIGLRVPETILGLDVDHYGDKRGGDTLKLYEEDWGALPLTIRSTSRDDGISGIRFYRVPPGLRFRNGLDSIEVVRHGHRYAMVWPSIHPEGRTYQWLDPDGDALESIPKVEDFPELPPRWVEELTVSALSHIDLSGDLTEITTGEPSADMLAALARGIEAIENPKGSRHDATCASVAGILRKSDDGYPGGLSALESLREVFVANVSGSRGGDKAAAEEFDRFLTKKIRGEIASTPSAQRTEKELNEFLAPEAEVVLKVAEKGAQKAGEGIRARRATDLTVAKDAQWIAAGRLPKAAPVLLVGDEGIGKSLFWVWLVGIITTGRGCKQFGIPKGPPMNVTIVVTEDDWSTEIRPRLEIVGADLARVTVICEDDDASGAPVFPRDLGVIPDETEFLVIDAWLDTVPGNLSVKDPQQARQALHPLKEWCSRTGATALLLTHTNRLKSASARDKYGISGELRKKARLTLFAQKDGEGQLTIGPEKANGTSIRKATMFKIESVPFFTPTEYNNGGTVGRVAYIGESDHTAAERITTEWEESQELPEAKDCKDWLRKYLDRNQGSVSAEQARKASHAEGFTPYAVRTAKRALHVDSKQVGGQWIWVSTL